MYALGLDYGSLSCRGVLVDTRNGDLIAQAEMAYPHGILDHCLPDGTALKGSWCLQHPDDYLTVLDHILPQLLGTPGVSPEQVVGIGVDFTASTVIPLDAQFRPLCKSYPTRPHAWPKLWKHHGATAQAEALTALCKERYPQYLDRYGGRISPECLIAKVIQVFQEDREIFDRANSFIEAMDYVTGLLCGEAVFSASTAVAKGFYHPESGYPKPDFFESIHPELGDLPLRKLIGRYETGRIAFPGEKIGQLCPEMAQRLGLRPGISISAPQMDAYAAMPGLGLVEPGTMLMVVGTSTGMILLSDTYRMVEGVTACLENTCYPGLWSYGSGQASVGDAFGWFVKNCVPESYSQAAREHGISIHQYLTQLAEAMAPGESGLLALDWLGGNRSCLGNMNLSGMLLGLTLQTRPEQIYRALLEATAFGARIILEAYRDAGVPVKEIRVCGGIPNKNPLLMQIYADVLGVPLQVSACTQAPALGAAIYAAAAARDVTGYDSVFEAVAAMGDGRCQVYQPNPQHKEIYEALYQEYRTLHDYFGRGTNSVMERLRHFESLGR